MKDEVKPIKKDLKDRTKKFALAVISLYSDLSKSTVSQVLGKQLLRSGTSVGAHYREAQRAKSDADFISKMEGGLQELEESGYWLELLDESGIMESSVVKPLQAEVQELVAIFVKIVSTVKKRKQGF